MHKYTPEDEGMIIRARMTSAYALEADIVIEAFACGWLDDGADKENLIIALWEQRLELEGDWEEHPRRADLVPIARAAIDWLNANCTPVGYEVNVCLDGSGLELTTAF